MSVLTNLKVLPMQPNNWLTVVVGHYYIYENNAYLAFYSWDLSA